MGSGGNMRWASGKKEWVLLRMVLGVHIKWVSFPFV